MDIHSSAPTRSRRTQRIIGLVVAIIVLAAGIGYAVVSNNPAIKLARALSNTVSTSTLSLSASAPAAYLQAAGLTDSDVASAGMGTITTVEELATAIENLTIEFASQTSSADTTVENAELSVQYGAATLLRLALIERVAYVQTQLQQIAKQPDSPVATQYVDQLFSLLDAAPQDLVTAVAALKSGRPLSLSMTKGSPLGDLYDQSFVNIDSPANQNRQNELGTAVLDALAGSVTVNAAGADTDGDIYNIAVDTKSFLKRLAPTLRSSYGDIEVAGLRVDRALQQLGGAHSILKLRAWLKGDVVNKIALDLTSTLPSRATLPAWSASATVRFLPISLAPPADPLDVTALANSLLSD